MARKKKRQKTVNRRDFLKTTSVVGSVTLVPAVFGVFSSCSAKTDLYYNTLADALDKLPNAFPRTESGVEILILKKIFSPEEAWLCGQLTVNFEPIASISERIGISPEETHNRLEQMLKRGLVWGDLNAGYVRLAAFIVGIYEEQVWEIDHELAHLMEDWFDEGGAEFMKYRPAIHRVVPAQSSVKSEWILPYDELISVLKTKKSFRVRDCICRLQQDLTGCRDCAYPLKTCLNFSSFERPPTDHDISLQEALDIIDEAERVGLVHCVSNIAEGFFYVCNCCGCCCGILRGITEWGIENSVAAANYYAVIDPDICIACKSCKSRCQVEAISKQDDVCIVNKESCIGCGVCVSGCDSGAARMELKPDDEIIQPPADLATWEQERLINRGIST